jgi:outer membrane lipoprotein-sorting protein
MPAVKGRDLQVAGSTGAQEPASRRPGARGLLALAVVCLAASPVAAEELDAASLVRRIEDVMRGDTVRYKAAMTITRPRWSRTVRLRSWDDRNQRRSLIRILAPAKDRGTGFLKVEGSLWTYLPRVERTIRMPPSMLLQSWMGSDFTNDDLVRESSIVDDYVPTLLGEREVAGVAAIGLELMPKEDAPAVWARIELWVDRERLAPLEETFFGEAQEGAFEPLRRMHFSDVREVQGRPFPHRWVMLVLDDPGKSTSFEIDEIRFDDELPDSLFSLATLKRAEAVR